MQHCKSLCKSLSILLIISFLSSCAVNKKKIDIHNVQRIPVQSAIDYLNSVGGDAAGYGNCLFTKSGIDFRSEKVDGVIPYHENEIVQTAGGDVYGVNYPQGKNTIFTVKGYCLFKPKDPDKLLTGLVSLGIPVRE